MMVAVTCSGHMYGTAVGTDGTGRSLSKQKSSLVAEVELMNDIGQKFGRRIHDEFILYPNSTYCLADLKIIGTIG